MTAGPKNTAHRPHVVYTCYNDDAPVGERLVYIGCTVNLGRRLSQHKGESTWYHLVTRITEALYPDKATGLAAEASAIRQLRPLYNRQSNVFRKFKPPAVPPTGDQLLTLSQAAGLWGMHIRDIALPVKRGWMESPDGFHVTNAAVQAWWDSLPTAEDITA